MNKKQIEQYFRLASIVRDMSASDKELDETEQMIVEGFNQLEKEYLDFFEQVNKC